MAAGLALLMAIACAVFVDLDGPGLAGVGIGAGLGLLNLAVGFFGRLVLVVGLLFAFHRTDAVDGVAFALVFMLFFFVYLGLEVVLVERALRGNGSPA